MGDIAIGLAEGKTLEQKAEARIKAENERYKEQNCAGLSAQACSAQMYEERRESLAYTLAGGAVVAGAVAGGMLLGPALLNACGMNPVACTELTIAAAEVPFGAATAGGAALGVGGFGSLGLKEVAATADAAAARNVETVTGGALGAKGTGAADIPATSSIARDGLRNDLAMQAGIPRSLDKVWGSSIDDLAQAYRMDGAKLVPKPPKPETSGNAQAFTVEGHPTIKEVQYHSGGGRHDAEYYKFTYRDGTEVRVIDSGSGFKPGTITKYQQYYDKQGNRLKYDAGQWKAWE